MSVRGPSPYLREFFQASGLKQSVLNIRPQGHTFTRNSEKYTDRGSNFLIADKKIMKVL